MDGVLVVDKPEGPTSHDVVAAVRRLLPRGTKVGHTGTLDPLATGVLPLLVGRATRLARFLTADRKRYHATVTFGRSTTTFDRSGETVRTASAAQLTELTPGRVDEALGAFRGLHRQVPPAYSAKKVEGRRAYERARSGDLTPPAPIVVEAYALRLLAFDDGTASAELALECSAGFYVRSLAQALGERIGVPAHLSALCRTASGSFEQRDATRLGDILSGAVAVGDVLRPLDSLLPEWPALAITASETTAVLHGQPLPPQCGDAVALKMGGPEGRVRLLSPDGQLVALARWSAHSPRILHADVVLGRPTAGAGPATGATRP